jgi:hypothetical protein
MSALGKPGRGDEPVVFVTELTAFFRQVGWIRPEKNPPKDRAWSKRKHDFYAFERSAWGIVRVRTDGERLLVFTDSGKRDTKEAYAYTMERGRPVPQALLRA